MKTNTGTTSNGTGSVSAPEPPDPHTAPAPRLLYYYHPDYLEGGALRNLSVKDFSERASLPRGREYITDANGLPYQYFWYNPCCRPKKALQAPLKIGSPESATIREGEALKKRVPRAQRFGNQKANTNAVWDSPYKFKRKLQRSENPERSNSGEQDEETGLYYYGARYYNPQISVWLSVDPKAYAFPNVTPYSFNMNNPIMMIDPGGDSTFVTANSDGTYKVVGGNLNGNDNGIYLINTDGTKKLIGYSATPESFYDGTKWRGTINPNDNSGRNFLNKLLSENPNEIYYAINATKGEKYDFKRTNGTSEQVYKSKDEFYRGMPILPKKKWIKYICICTRCGKYWCRTGCWQERDFMECCATGF